MAEAIEVYRSTYCCKAGCTASVRPVRTFMVEFLDGLEDTDEDASVDDDPCDDLETEPALGWTESEARRVSGARRTQRAKSETIAQSLIDLCAVAPFIRRQRHHLSLSETQFGWQVRSNRVMLLPYERCLQLDRIVPIASVVGS